MGDNTGGGAFRLYPISYQCVGMWISKGFRLIYKRVDPTSHDPENFHNPPINTFTADGLAINRPALKRVVFLRNYKNKHFFIDATH
jgi:hypothetical protein